MYLSPSVAWSSVQPEMRVGKFPAPRAGIRLEIGPAQKLEQVESTVVMPCRRDVAHAPQRTDSIEPQSAEPFRQLTHARRRRGDATRLQVAAHRLHQPRHLQY